ncbi:insulinase family protein [Candidatus Babeliales bacterium]|nr:insulinase family protein [Candidatus Babeliales bacterium]
MSFISGTVVKKILLNGLTILVNPVTNIPKVSMELWYHVGSRDEKSGEKGLAHLIEHMIFKGTAKLSESDINMITHKLSGSTNAFTMHDATGYTFQFPSQHWKEGLNLLSDCMRNAHFNEQMLNSELKAVIQELKMYRDSYIHTVIDELFEAMYHDHPYHYPIIGFKQDLWNLKRDTLFNFYKKHYIPNNAVLTVVGDVTPEEVFEYAEKMFGGIASDLEYKKEEFYHSHDLISKQITIHRDVQQPVVVLAADLPGAKSKNHFTYDVLSWILGAGRDSRLTKKLVDDLQLVTSFETFFYDLQDATPFFIYFEPKDIHDIPKIKEIINEEIKAIIDKGLTQKELTRAIKKMKTSRYSMLESQGKRVHEISQAYLHTGDENFVFNYFENAPSDVEQNIKELLAGYFLPSMMHLGQVLPLTEQDKGQWVLLQERSDTEDAKILDGRVRHTDIEPARHAHSVSAQPPKEFHFSRPQKTTLKNGIKLFVHNNKTVPKIDILVSLKAKSYYDPADKEGLYAIVCDMLLEGTKNYPGTKLSEKLEEYGMSFSAQPGILTLSLLSEDLEKGLELLHEILTEVVINEEALLKIKEQACTDLKFYWDSPKDFSDQLVRNAIYKNHPYSMHPYGTIQSVKCITKKDVETFYKTHFVPQGTRISVVGDLQNYSISELLEKYIGVWQGVEVKDVSFPDLTPEVSKHVAYPINRDQVVVVFAKDSINRLDSDYDKLMLFEQIFSGGSMSSRLFQLRERSGLFYTITGSLTHYADEQPGIFMVKTIVSLNRLEEAKKVILETMQTVVDTLTEQELEEAKHLVINSQVNNFAANKRIGYCFLAIDQFNFPEDYFDTRAQHIHAITLDEVKNAARKIIDCKKLVTFEIGRVQEQLG